MKDLIKLHLGCGAILKDGWVNIDSESKEEIIERYGISGEERRQLELGPEIHQYDIFNLPFDDNSIDEILSEGMIEHLSFAEEPLFFYECARVLKPGGTLNVQTDDFDGLISLWLEAKDDFKEFYRLGSHNHWFGENKKDFENRWGLLVTCFFGNQSSPGQYHRNCYTEKKLLKVFELIGFNVPEISREKYKGQFDPMIRAVGQKR